MEVQKYVSSHSMTIFILEFVYQPMQRDDIFKEKASDSK